MYNTLARVIGVTVLGGAAVFAGYSLTQGKGPEDKTPAQDEAVIADPSIQATAPDGTVAGAPAATSELDDLLATDETGPTSEGSTVDTQDPSSPYDTDRLAALGEGGILGDETSPVDMADSTGTSSESASSVSSDTMAILEDLSNEGSSDPDGLANTLEAPLDDPAAQDAVAAMAAAQAGLRGLPANPEASQETSANADGQRDDVPAATPMDNVAANTASTDAETADLASSAVASTTDDKTRDTVADLPARAGAQMADTMPTKTTGTDQQNSTATKTNNGAGKAMFANAVEADKPDDGRFFTTNKKLIDKPDDGAYFTAQDSGAAYSPCVKADGTPYIGPGTALNPFADASPCLPQATAESFDVASNLLTATDSDGLPEAPQWPVVSDPRTPFPPLGPNFTSDYTSL